jgi:HEAT repeat protein
MFFDDKATQIEKCCQKRNSAKLVGLVKDSKPEIRILAIKALAKIGDENAVNTLLENLNNPDPATRLEVIRASGTMNNQTIKSHLQHLIQTETNEDIKKVIREAISDIPNRNYGTKQ